MRFSVRYPPETTARLQYHRRTAGVVANSFIVEATNKALDEAGVPRDVPVARRAGRRKSKQSA